MEIQRVSKNDHGVWLFIIDCAKHLKISKETIYRWTYKEVILAYKLGKQWRYSQTEIDNWVISGKAALVD